ncbi:MAG: FAD binding domain-containing protein, partial [Actinobacteria bacterium]|nr:FAD binding domain-containing protein [Actinomycetota bacterium]
MIPAPFEYERADSADAAIALLGQHGDDAKLLAGGHSLIPSMKLRLLEPKYLIDLARVPDLTGIRLDGEEVVIGAMTRHAD